MSGLAKDASLLGQVLDAFFSALEQREEAAADVIAELKRLAAANQLRRPDWVLERLSAIVQRQNAPPSA